MRGMASVMWVGATRPLGVEWWMNPDVTRKVTGFTIKRLDVKVFVKSIVKLPLNSPWSYSLDKAEGEYFTVTPRVTSRITSREVFGNFTSNLTSDFTGSFIF